MVDEPRRPPRLTLLPGGRAETEGPAGRPPRPGALRLIPGGPAGELQVAIEATVQAARRMRAEIEARIARDLPARR